MSCNKPYHRDFITCEGIVTQDIDPTVGAGRINVGGEDWAARSPEVIVAGVKVRVTGADGIVLEVTRT